MSDFIPFKYRFVAALLHGLGKIPLVSVAVFIVLSLLEPDLNYTVESVGIIYGLFVGLPLIFAQPIVSLILWQLSKRWHPFIDIAGKIAVNRSVNALVAMTVTIFLIIAIGTTNPNTLGASNIFNTVSVAIVYAIAIGYFIDAVVASTFALQGKVFRNRSIHYFIKVDR
jgi:uncharacterized Tic20 family protein